MYNPWKMEESEGFSSRFEVFLRMALCVRERFDPWNKIQYEALMYKLH